MEKNEKNMIYLEIALDKLSSSINFLALIEDRDLSIEEKDLIFKSKTNLMKIATDLRFLTIDL